MAKETLIQKLKRAVAMARVSFHLMTSPSQYVPVDVGVAEQTIDRETGEVIKTIRREAYSDTTVITERGADGRMNRYTETPVRQADGSYKIVRNAPRVMVLQTR